jgi:molybdate transport system substrate-binding protein
VNRKVLLVLSLLVGLLAACGQGSESPTGSDAASATAADPSEASPSEAQEPVALTVLAAASLTDAGAALEAAYAAANSNVDLTFSFDGSSALRGQIEAGAAADIFLSADARNPQALEDGELTTGEQVPFASNLLTIIVPSDNPAGIESWTDLATPGVRVVAAGEDVPIQQYADEAIANLGEEEGAAEGFAEAVASNFVSREDNVRAVLTRIELGEGDAAIVYVTDAMSSEDVAAIEIPETANVPAVYVGVGLDSTAAEDAVAAFMAWLVEDEAQSILADFGFSPPPS